MRIDPEDKTEDRFAYLSTVPAVLREDDAHVQKKDRQYGSSWKRRGGVGAYMMLARKWDRIEEMVEHHMTAPYDILRIIDLQADMGGADGTVLAEIRDLRRYLALVEAWMVHQGAVQLSDEARWPEQEQEQARLSPDFFETVRYALKKYGIDLSLDIGGNVSVFQIMPATSLTTSFVREAQEQRSRFETLRDLLQAELGVSVIEEGLSMRLQRGLTAVQEEMARHMAKSHSGPGAAGSAAVLEAPADRVGGSQAAAEPAPATPAEAASPGAPVSLEPGQIVKVEGEDGRWTVLSRAAHDYWRLRRHDSESWQDVHISRIYTLQNLSRAEDDGVHAVEDLPFSRDIRREPIDATAMEYDTIKEQRVGRGSRADSVWGELYTRSPTGRYSMLPEYHEEYGR